MDVVQFGDAVRPWLAAGEGPLRAHLTLAIRQAISSGQLPNGSRLPPERALASMFHVSRPTVSGVVDDLRSAGLVSSRQGSGSWISGGVPQRGPAVPFIERVQAAGSIDLASATASDASGVPAFRLEASDLLGIDPSNGLTPIGLWKLREQVAERASRHAPTSADNVMITSGAHQALGLLIASLCAPGSTILLEETTYGGLVDMVHINGCHPIAIPRDGDGPDPAKLSDLIARHRPSMVIVVTSVHSPTGVISSPERAADLAGVLNDVEAHVVLDETYAELDFAQRGRLLSEHLGDRVIRTGSLSKTVWTGLRTGWIIAGEPVLAEVGRRRWQQFDLGPAAPSQLVASAAFEELDDLVDSRCTQLQEQERWMRSRIASDFPEWSVTPVHGGLAMWVELPSDGDAYAEFAASRRVSVLPGSACRTDQAPTPHIRICFDRPIDVLEDAFARLAAS